MQNSAGMHFIVQSLFTSLCNHVNNYGLRYSSVALSCLGTVHINSLIHTQLDFKQLKLWQYI